MHNAYHIRGGRVIDPVSRRDERADIFIRDGRICDPRKMPASGVETLEAEGLIVVPGFVDIHAHFREPGGEKAETIASGSQSAACGGFTTIVTMPNTQPPIDSPSAIKFQIRTAKSIGLVSLYPSGCLTRGRKGASMADLTGMAKAGAVAFTDDGATVTKESLLEQIMLKSAQLHIPVMDHALDPDLAGQGVMHEGAQSRRLGLPGIPSRAESDIVERDIRLVRKTGCHIHIQHVSCAKSVELIAEARKQGLPVSGEATPHHLSLTDADVDGTNPDFKLNPPLREQTDRDAILRGVADGTLSALATDHAPHTRQSKDQGFLHAPFGIVGLETAVALTYSELVSSGRMSLIDWIHRWTSGPRRIVGLPNVSLLPGQVADLALLNLSADWIVPPFPMASKSDNTPFKGRHLAVRVACTFHEGQPTWKESR